MRVVVTGGAGMLGQALGGTLADRGHQVESRSRADLDITSLSSCQEGLADAEVVVNAAAWTRVDDAEAHEAPAFEANAVGAANVARVCAATGSRLVHLSTDYVFAGDATSPYAEDAPLRPRSAYGRTKAAGEWAVRALAPDALVVRTAWLYGPGGPNFARTMARLASERERLTVVDDQRGAPTTTRDVARFVADLVDHPEAAGTFHATNEGETTWHGYASAVFEELGLDPERVQPIPSTAFPLPAPRPAYSVLGHARSTALGIPPLPHWRTALSETLAETLGVVDAKAGR